MRETNCSNWQNSGLTLLIYFEETSLKFNMDKPYCITKLFDLKIPLSKF